MLAGQMLRSGSLPVFERANTNALGDANGSEMSGANVSMFGCVIARRATKGSSEIRSPG